MSCSAPTTQSPEPPVVVSLTASFVTATTLIAAFGSLALGFDAWWIAFPVGFGAVMPLAVGAAKAWTDRAGSVGATRERKPAERTDESRSTDGEDVGLATLRERYARGEIDEDEFEHRVATLLASEERERAGSRYLDAEPATEWGRDR